MKDVWQALSLLESEDAGVRARASRCIADLGAACEPAIPELVSLLKQEHLVLVDDVRIALQKIGTPVVPEIMSRLESATGQYRVNLLSVLSSDMEPFDQIMLAMTAALGEADPAVRMQAAYSVVGFYFSASEGERSSRDWSSVDIARSLLEQSKTDPATSHYWPSAQLCLRELARLHRRNGAGHT